MTGVEHDHGVDFSDGIPAAYGILAALLNAVIEGIQPDFAVVKLEGDAVFAAAPAARLDGQGDRVLHGLGSMYRSFVDSRHRAIPSADHVCTACPTVAHLDLKAVLHRGHVVRQAVGSGSDLLGPSVTVAHRLLKNSVRARTGIHPYLFMTDAAAVALGLSRPASPTTRSTRTPGASRAASSSSPSSAPSSYPVARVAVLELPGMVHHVVGGSPDEELDRPGAGRPPVGVVRPDLPEIRQPVVLAAVRGQDGVRWRPDLDLARELLGLTDVDVADDLLARPPGASRSGHERAIDAGRDLVEGGPTRAEEIEPSFQVRRGQDVDLDLRRHVRDAPESVELEPGTRSTTSTLPSFANASARPARSATPAYRGV